ncbi:MAG: site-2 protease family protein [bacterium]|nr:site-2 protease family protein [bacterium]
MQTSLNPESSGPGGGPVVPPPPPQKYLLNLVLFILTFFSTLYAGASLAGIDSFQEPGRLFSAGASFAVPLMAILLTHESGHYFFSRFHKVEASLPYFIPAPIGFGTFGAIIRMNAPIQDRRALLDIGTAGPLAGFLVSIPAVIIGFKFAQVVPSGSFEGINLGNSLAFAGLEKIFMGNLAEGQEILIHPIGFAGWIGLFITTLNLIPYGQLDGGHIIYALLGEKNHQLIGKIIVPVLFAMGFLGLLGSIEYYFENFDIYFNLGLKQFSGFITWFFWFLLLKIMGSNHPPVEEARVELSTGRKILGWATMFIFLLTFIPAPFQMK